VFDIVNGLITVGNRSRGEKIPIYPVRESTECFHGYACLTGFSSHWLFTVIRAAHPERPINQAGMKTRVPLVVKCQSRAGRKSLLATLKAVKSGVDATRRKCASSAGRWRIWSISIPIWLTNAHRQNAHEVKNSTVPWKLLSSLKRRSSNGDYPSDCLTLWSYSTRSNRHVPNMRLSIMNISDMVGHWFCWLVTSKLPAFRYDTSHTIRVCAGRRSQTMK